MRIGPPSSFDSIPKPERTGIPIITVSPAGLAPGFQMNNGADFCPEGAVKDCPIHGKQPAFDVPEMHQIIRDLLQQQGLADFDELCELVKKREGW